MRFTTVARDAAANAVVDLIDAASPGAPGTLEIYSGPRPVSAITAPSGSNTLLATLTFSATAYGDSGAAGGNSAGTVVADTITPATTGVIGGLDATWFRILDGNGVVVMDGTILKTGVSGTADMRLDDIRFVTGATVSISLSSLTMLSTCP
jgi:hypothetical protein